MRRAGLVWSCNEWDKLEEVIVGSVLGAAKMAFEPSINAYFNQKGKKPNLKAKRYSKKEIKNAEQQLDNFAALLENEGIVVRRPDKFDYFQPIKTPDFNIQAGNSRACPRDVLLLIGDEIIEAPMAQRARFFEYRAYRSLIKDYFLHGARWTSAPKPLMSDSLYVSNYSVVDNPFDADTHPALTDFEPCFDAASFVRFGRDIFYLPDLVTNDFGARWLQRHLGKEFRIHRIKIKDKHPPQHIDTTLVPIRPGIVLINPERPCIDNTIEFFNQNNWEAIPAPPSVARVDYHSPEVSNWISMNVLCLDESTVVVEEKEFPLIHLLESIGSKVITCAFSEVYKFGGGFHCCTADIRRRGDLRSYFPSLDE